MATLTKRKDGQWQAKIRRRGYPMVSKTFGTKAKAERWARIIEKEMDESPRVCRRVFYLSHAALADSC